MTTARPIHYHWGRDLSVVWLGLVALKDPRAAVMAGPAPCCELNDAATWSARDFHSIQVNPKVWGVIAPHLLMSNCEHNGPGGYEIIDTIKVDYSVLGFPRAEDVSVGRTGSSRPTRVRDQVRRGSSRSDELLIKPATLVRRRGVEPPRPCGH